MKKIVCPPTSPYQLPLTLLTPHRRGKLFRHSLCLLSWLYLNHHLSLFDTLPHATSDRLSYPPSTIAMPGIVSDATKIWDENQAWACSAQCATWDPSGRRVDVWECVRERAFNSYLTYRWHRLTHGNGFDTDDSNKANRVSSVVACCPRPRSGAGSFRV
jgi:hypothetical protein